MAVVSDKRTPVITGSEITGYTPELLIAKDYYPFGMEMSGRYGGDLGTEPGDEYRFGFNGKEKDDEWNGQTGSTYDFGARLYDARIGRWMACDPKAAQMPFISPYSFSYNCPTIFEDPDGEKPRVTVSKSQDGSEVTISITNNIYLVEKNNKINVPTQSNVDNYLHGGSYEVDGVKYNVVINNNFIKVKNTNQAKNAIIKDRDVGVIAYLRDKGRANAGENQGFDVINLFTNEDNFEAIFAHEIGHDIGFADKYIDVGYFSYVFIYFVNTLMGDVSAISDYEIHLIGSDVMNQINEQGGIQNGETIELNEGRGTRAVNTAEDALPYKETVQTYLCGSNYEKAYPVSIIRINDPSRGTAKGRKVKNPPTESKPSF
jgi:RHS repeat-associated protein